MANLMSDPGYSGRIDIEGCANFCEVLTCIVHEEYPSFLVWSTEYHGHSKQGGCNVLMWDQKKCNNNQSLCCMSLLCSSELMSERLAQKL